MIKIALVWKEVSKKLSTFALVYKDYGNVSGQTEKQSQMSSLLIKFNKQ